MFPTDKFGQLVSLVTVGVQVNDLRHSQSQYLTVLPQMWNEWSKQQQTVDNYINPGQDDVGSMAANYLNFLYLGGAKPEWLAHMGF